MASPNPFGNLLGDLIKAALLLNLRTCSGCKRLNDPSNADFGDWVIKTALLIPVGAKCPDCQTPEERADAVIQQAIGTKYKLDGILIVPEDPKPEGGDDEGGSQSQAS